MSPSNDIQTNPGQAEAPVAQPTAETTPTSSTTTTTTTTTNHNSNTATLTTNKNKEVDSHNKGDNIPETVVHPIPEITTTSTTNNSNTATLTTSEDKKLDNQNNGDNTREPVRKNSPVNAINNNKNHNGSNEEVMCPWICDLLFKGNNRQKQGEKDEKTKQEEKKKQEEEDHDQRWRKSQKHLDQITQNVKELENFAGEENENCKELRTYVNELQNILDTEKKHGHSKAQCKLPEINKEIVKFKQHFSSAGKLSKKLSLSPHLQRSSRSNGQSQVQESVNIHESASFRGSSFYEEIQEILNGLEGEKKFLLSCFTVFPENAVVKRRILVYWGVGEEILNPTSDTPEKIVDGILEEFQEKGLIEPDIKKRKQQVKSYKMHPLVRSAIVAMLSQKVASQESVPQRVGNYPNIEYKGSVRSQEAGSQRAGHFIDYDSKGNVLPQRDWTAGLDSKGNKVAPRSKRLCLQKVVEEERKLSTQKETVTDSDLEKLVTLFNVNEPFPDLELAWLAKMKDKDVGQMKEPSAVDWLSKMKNAKVVCLGSWPGSAKSHTEVESIEFLKGLTSSTNLSFLSLQGISRITELPDSIGKLSNLVILDLKECHNLEVLSEEISQLKNLRYLDLSDCHLLARMPKGLGDLSELQVLKGFVISNPQRKNSGTLDDLKELAKLRKLTINASSEEFPKVEDLRALQKLGKKELRNLTIAWGSTIADEQGKETKPDDQKGAALAGQQGKEAKPEYKKGRESNCWKRLIPATKQPKSETTKDQLNEKLPEQLVKLDLQCFPQSTATWLTHDSLPNLEKLYIRGGSLAILDNKKWLKVKTLRLKYLAELKMTWIQLQDSFQGLEYLEKVKCPGITLCPCDEHGVWMKN